MIMSDDDHSSRPVPSGVEGGVRRFEVFTGAGRRRDWPAAAKASIVAETYSGAETVCAVARRYGIAPSQLFVWRRQLRGALEAQPASAERAFVPAVVEPAPAPAPAPVTRRVGKRRPAMAGAVELEIDGAVVRIARGADAGVIAVVIAALKANR